MHAGRQLREQIYRGDPLPFIGIYDVFSATLAAQSQCVRELSGGLFLSGFGLAASQYGFPDVGFSTWQDVLSLAQRIRAIAADTPLLVDIDDGFADNDVAAQVTRQLEQANVSGVIFEDQARPRRCGHLGGKVLMPLDQHLERLDAILSARSQMIVVARTDASDREEIFRRVDAFDQTQADVILVDGLSDVGMIAELRRYSKKPLAFNQISGGKSPRLSLSDLDAAGVQLAIYSTPLLFAAQAAMQKCLAQMHERDMCLDDGTCSSVLSECQQVLQANLGKSPILVA